MDGWNLNSTYAELPGIFYRRQKPVCVDNPVMVVFNDELARDLGLDADRLRNAADIFSGSKLPHGSKPISLAYAGYQFGHFNKLGDGRAVLLGEQTAPDGGIFDIQLKGSGITPFSRGGDGLAALQPMLREYIISEAMHYLGIPTTRSLAVVLTGEDVYRERVMPGAVLTRVASSHIRVGTFNYISMYGTTDDLQKLADYTINRHFPWLNHADDKYLHFFRETALLQASLITKWQLTGFIHGVMNTDNMAISGETIDYGPCAFMDTYDPDTVFSSIDSNGRYAYKNQPMIGAWNLSRLAESLLPLFDEQPEKAVEIANAEIENYRNEYNENLLNGMRRKIGLFNEEPEDAELITELLDFMFKNELDYTNTFRFLPYTIDNETWNKKWHTRLERQRQNQRDVIDLMTESNPAVIPRNHRVEEALAAAEGGDYNVMFNLLEALRNPFTESDIYSQPPELTACKYKTFCGT